MPRWNRVKSKAIALSKPVLRAQGRGCALSPASVSLLLRVTLT